MAKGRISKENVRAHAQLQRSLEVVKNQVRVVNDQILTLQKVRDRYVRNQQTIEDKIRQLNEQTNEDKNQNR